MYLYQGQGKNIKIAYIESHLFKKNFHKVPNHEIRIEAMYIETTYIVG